MAAACHSWAAVRMYLLFLNVKVRNASTRTYQPASTRNPRKRTYTSHRARRPTGEGHAFGIWHAGQEGGWSDE